MEKTGDPSETVIRDLAKRGLPVDQISFMMRVSQSVVERVLAAAVNPPATDRAPAQDKPKAR